MDVRQFIQTYREDWQKLENFIITINKNKREKTSEDIHEFHRTYIKVTQAFSYSQTYFPEEEVTAYLNELVAKAHNLLYQDKVSSRSQFKHFFTQTFIKLLFEQRSAILIAFCLFTFGALAGFISVVTNPLNLYTIIPNEIAYSVDPNFIGATDGAPGASFMSAEILTNNIQVAFLAFAGGITFGLLTVYVLIFNGILVGALAAVFWNAGKSYEFWAYIVPHGMIELTAIFIAGGAGLLMGYKLFVPGKHTRVHQLKVQAKRSVQLIIGTIPLFVIAGIIEGYITPASISLEMKYIVALLTVFGLVLYAMIGASLLRKNASKQSAIH